MDTALAPLWDRIAAFALDEPGAEWTFTQRLARENRWTEAHAARVVAEYRRFLLLAMAAGHPVTPSDGVDQAWHLHLTYTRSYWDDLCGTVLGRPLHHGPTRGGAAESAKFHDWYARTRESYRRIFGAEPPADIWPPAEDRFGRDLHFERVNTQTHWVVPRPATLLRILAPAARLGGPAALGLMLLAVVVGCGRAAMGPPPAPIPDVAHMAGRDFLRLYTPLAVFAVVLSVLARRRAAADGEWVSDPEFLGPLKASDAAQKLDPYALIFLLRGPTRTAPVTAAIARLVDAGALVVDGATGRLEAAPRPAGRTLHPLEEVAWNAASRYPKRSGAALAPYVAMSSELDALRDSLRAAGYVRSATESRLIRLAALAPIALTLALGAWRMYLGTVRGRPIGYLVLVSVALLFVTAIHCAIPAWRTRRGETLRAALKARHATVATPPESPSDPNFPLAFALIGLAALPDTPTYKALRQHFAPANDGGGGGGCGGGGGGGGGCGGGGCGGGGGGGCGGGGCGGCGGG
jgi:uncharacterized protein (TIGR04222 family)